MLAIALGGRELATRLRTQGPRLRVASGVVIALVALAIAFHQDERFQTALPGYTQALQDRIEGSSRAQGQLSKLTGRTHRSAPGLKDYGEAPELHPSGRWFNSSPLTMRGLRGKVVLVDFWTYSCINCLRTLPHLKAWDAAYRRDGLVILGVHTPEFAFEHNAGNVRSAVERLGIRYPVMQDNAFRTWNAYANQYWPAEYMVDRNGRVRHVHFGEGSYGETEALIRRLLGVAEGARARHVADTTPRGVQTPETYLGYDRLDRYVGSPLRPDRDASYTFPGDVPQNGLAYAGRWRVEGERAVAGGNARLRLHFYAANVYLVLGGRGQVQVLVDGKATKTVRVDAYKLYTLRSGRTTDAQLELRFAPGVEAYAFTFG